MDLIEGAIILLGTIAAQVTYIRAKRLGRFDNAGKAKIFLFNVMLAFVFLGLPTFTYAIWQLSGFTDADARQAGQTMIDSYLKQGAQKVDADFIVVSHSSMRGYVTVTGQDGSQQTLKCEAIKGEGAQYLTTCTP